MGYPCRQSNLGIREFLGSVNVESLSLLLDMLNPDFITLIITDSHGDSSGNYSRKVRQLTRNADRYCP